MIMVVEDDPALRRTALRALESMGYEAVLAELGAEALERVRLGQRFDLIISDFHLPDMNGVALQTRLRELGFAGGFLLTSGSLEESLPEAATPTGVRFLSKPYSLSELAQAVEAALISAAG